MTNTDMEDVVHAISSTATPKLYISDRTGETLGPVVLTLEILPASNFRSTEVVLVELFIDNNLRGHRLIEGSSPDRKMTFTVIDKYLRAGQRNESDVHDAYFHITHGALIRRDLSKPKSLTKIKGNVYRVLHKFTNHNLHEEGGVDQNETAEHSKADDADHDTSQENFYDARSQFDNLPGTLTTEEDVMLEDLDTAEGDSPKENEHILTSSGTGKNANITTSPAEDNLTRLDQAKRVIFKEDSQPIMEPAIAASPSPANATSPSVQDPDTEMLDNLAINTEQSDNDEESSHQKKPMQTFGTISEYLSSNKLAAQHGINSDSGDPEDEAASLVHNSKPLRRTSFAPPESALQPDIPNDSMGDGMTKEASLNGKDDSDTEDDETTAAAPSLKKRKDPAKQKAYNANRAASGARVNGELRKRLADNDEKIGVKGAVVKLWQGKNLGDNQDIKAANIRLKDIITKQVKLHDIRSVCPDANATSDLRQRLKPWVKGKIDEYENQLDTIISTAKETPSNVLASPKQQADSDPAEDSDDDFALPLMSSQQRRMAAALLSEDQPARRTTEAAPRESPASDQQVQTSTSPTMHSRDNNTSEDSDNDELPDPNDLFTPRLPRGSFTKITPTRDAGKSLERPKKKPRKG